jgi:hypothetical protein
VIQLESFYKLSTNKYDLIVLDEVVSLQSQMFGSTNAGKLKDNWRSFVNMMKFNKKIIALDANLTCDTVKFLKSFQNTAVDYTELNYKNGSSDTMYVFDDIKIAQNKILDLVECGKNI